MHVKGKYREFGNLVKLKGKRREHALELTWFRYERSWKIKNCYGKVKVMELFVYNVSRKP